jgi:hypothetical protein
MRLSERTERDTVRLAILRPVYGWFSEGFVVPVLLGFRRRMRYFEELEGVAWRS